MAITSIHVFNDDNGIHVIGLPAYGNRDVALSLIGDHADAHNIPGPEDHDKGADMAHYAVRANVVDDVVNFARTSADDPAAAWIYTWDGSSDGW